MGSNDIELAVDLGKALSKETLRLFREALHLKEIPGEETPREAALVVAFAQATAACFVGYERVRSL